MTLVGFDDVVQCREPRHLNSVQTTGPTDEKRSFLPSLHTDKDERNNNLLFTKGCGYAGSAISLMFLIFVISSDVYKPPQGVRHVSRYQN